LSTNVSFTENVSMTVKLGILATP